MKKQEVNERASHASNPKSKSLYPDLSGPEFVDPQFFEKKSTLEKSVPPFWEEQSNSDTDTNADAGNSSSSHWYQMWVKGIGKSVAQTLKMLQGT